MEKKNLKTFLLVGASAFLVTLLTSPSLVSSLTLAGETPGVSCADITFGTTQFSDSTAVSASSFATHNLESVTVSLGDGTATCYGASSSGTSAARVGSSGNSGTLVFDFSSSLVITKVKILAYQYSSTSATCTVTTSALANGTAQTISNSASPDITDASNDAGYVFAGLDGGTLTASSSLSITSSKRFNLCKIVLTLNGYSSSTSQGISSSSGATSTPTSSTASSSYSTYRISPVTSSGSSVNAYTITYTNGSYKAAISKTLTKGTYYIDPEEVALYYQAFKEFPSNYYHYTDGSSPTSSDKSTAFGLYGTSARLWTTYTRSDGYTTYFPTLNTQSYIEADIDVDGTYAQSSSWNRGTGRLVVVPSGVTTYGSDSWIVKTVDHYAHFTEFANYVGGWGQTFDAQTTTTYPATGVSWSALSTVTYTVA